MYADGMLFKVLAGVLVAVSGFQPLFFIVLAAQIAALGLLVIKVREPRNRAPLF